MFWQSPNKDSSAIEGIADETIGRFAAWRSALGSTPSNGQVQQTGDEMKEKRVKRTTPFTKQCNFIMDLGSELEQCSADAEHGIYFGDDRFVKMISLCKYHTIYQESLWRGEKQ